MEKSVLIFFKGDFVGNVAGVAVRYISVANALLEDGWKVTIAGRSVPRSQEDINYIGVGSIFSLVKGVLSSKCIVLHGGGPVALLLFAVGSLFGKSVLLDSFAPHWIELYCSPSRGIKKRVKVAFNLSRIVWASYFFDAISVGTTRQRDLIRGVVAPFSGPARMRDVVVITGGCDEASEAGHAGVLSSTTFEGTSFQVYKTDDGVVDFAWLGGVWPWFDVEFVLKSFIAFHSEVGGRARLHFFGVDPKKKNEMVGIINSLSLGFEAVYFHPWVDYSDRFEVWRGVDCAVVWSEGGLENDYASRTRNFDCITLGVPVIQNRDSFWGEILDNSGAGVVVDSEGELPSAFLRMADENLRKEMSVAVSSLQDRFKWSRIADGYADILEKPKRRVGLRGLVLGLIVYPLIVLGLVFVCGDEDD